MNLVLWSFLTIACFFSARWIFLRTRQPLLHPVLWGTAGMVAFIELTGHSYQSYKAETDWVVSLLGPAVVALAVPVYRLRQLIFRHLGLLLVVIITAVFFSTLSVSLLLCAFPLDRAVIKALSLKSITAPVAFEISRETGGLPALTAIGVMFAGIMGAILGPWALRRTGIRDPQAVGLALGCTSHGVGTARALELGETEGAFARASRPSRIMRLSLVDNDRVAVRVQNHGHVAHRSFGRFKDERAAAVLQFLDCLVKIFHFKSHGGAIR